MIDLGSLTVVCGQKDSGKSMFIESALTDMTRFVCIDPKREHLPPNSTVVRSVRELYAALSDGKERVVVRVKNFDTDKFKDVIRVCRNLQDCFVVIDEVHRFMNENTIPEPFRWFVQEDLSHNNIGLVLGTQFLTKINGAAFQQTDDFILYAYGSLDDKKLRDVLNKDTRQMLESLNARRFEYLHIPVTAREKPEIRSRVPIPKHVKEKA